MPEWLNKDTVSIAATVISLVAGPAVLWWLGRHFARRAAIDDLARRLDRYAKEHGDVHQALEGRLAAGEREFQGLRSELSRLPQRDDMDQVERGLTALSVQVSALSATVDAINVNLAGIREGVQMLTSHELAQARGDRS